MEFWYYSKLQYFVNFRNFTNCKFLEFYTLDIFEIFQIGELTNFEIFNEFCTHKIQTTQNLYKYKI